MDLVLALTISCWALTDLVPALMLMVVLVSDLRSRCSPQVKKSSPAEEQAKTSPAKEDPNKAPHGWSGKKKL